MYEERGEVLVSPTDQSFDALAKGLAEGPVSRRRAVKLLGGALLGGALATLGFGRTAEAAPCPAPGIKCFGSCCTGGQQCIQTAAGASCQCPSGEILCGPEGNKQCTNYLTNPLNCGNCGIECLQGQECVAGQCVCPQGQSLCSSTCVTNCSGGREFNAQCQCVCPSGTTACGGNCVTNCSGGLELNLETCQCECPSGQIRCNGQCVSTTCAGGRQFNVSSCTCECPSGTTLCNNTCVNNCPSGQQLNTETCTCACPETTCTGGRVLNQSTCVCECPPGCACEGQLCTSKNECCNTNARCAPAKSGPLAGRKVCTA